MPIHDWTKIPAGGFHTFRKDWTVELKRRLNRGVLPPGYSAFTELRVDGWEPDVVAIGADGAERTGGVAVATAPPRAKQMSRIRTDAAKYAQRANSISIREEFCPVVAVIEVVSPVNKVRKRSVREFVTKVVDFLSRGVNVVIVNLFPPTPRDPDGLHAMIWAELTDEPFDLRPPDKPLTVASYETGNGFAAYVDPVAVGDELPETPLFLAPGWYVSLPLESTYCASWAETPQPIKAIVEPGRITA